MVWKNAQGRSKQSPFAASLDKLTHRLILFLCVQTEFKLEGIYVHINEWTRMATLAALKQYEWFKSGGWAHQRNVGLPPSCPSLCQRGGRLFTPSTLCVPVHCVVCIYLNTTLYPIYCGGIEYPRGCMYATYTFFHDWCLPPNWLVATLDRTYSRLCSLCPLCLISTCGTCELWTLIFRKACLRMVTTYLNPDQT